jgi:chromatin remodeling complex protein RSC6
VRIGFLYELYFFSVSKGGKSAYSPRGYTGNRLDERGDLPIVSLVYEKKNLCALAGERIGKCGVSVFECFSNIARRTNMKKQSALMKPVQVSDALAEIVGKGPMPRTEVTKKLWEYIKKNKLQDSKQKRQINPDQKLGRVIGNQQIDMFQMTKKVSTHLRDVASK